MNTPHTLHGTNGLITVPASSSVRDRLRGCKPSLAYTGLNVSPASKMDRYCSPIKIFTPTLVIATQKVARPALMRKRRIASNSAGTMPSANSKPPKLNASITTVCVKNILSKPPRDTSLAMPSPTCSGLKPANSQPPSCPAESGVWVKVMAMETAMVASMVKIASTLNNASTTNTANGNSA